MNERYCMSCGQSLPANAFMLQPSNIWEEEQCIECLKDMREFLYNEENNVIASEAKQKAEQAIERQREYMREYIAKDPDAHRERSRLAMQRMRAKHKQLLTKGE